MLTNTPSATARRIVHETEMRESAEWGGIQIDVARDFDPDEHALRAQSVPHLLATIDVATTMAVDRSGYLPVSGDELARVRKSLAPRPARSHIRLVGVSL